MKRLAPHLLLPLLLAASPATAITTLDIGLAANGTRIDALAVDPDRGDFTVVIIGGLDGDDASVASAQAAARDYAALPVRPARLLVVPLANPAGETLVFPPSGIAYREQTASHVLWRWLGAQAPDLVLITGSDAAGLASALGTTNVADMGRIPARRWSGTGDWSARLQTEVRSEARLELQRRLALTPRQYAQELAAHYGRDFEQPWYISAVALIARLRLGEVAEVEQLVEPWVDGTRDSLARPNSLVMAGHTVFAELARRTPDPRYVAAVRKVADLGFDTAGQMRESMPHHDGYSDSVYMGAAIVAQAGALTGERRYFDMADRHLQFMQQLDLRPDGLYRHRPTADVPWGRGNGFAAIGLALTLSELPVEHPGHPRTLDSFRRLMAALLPYQTQDGLWRNVVNLPGAWPELSSTAMIGFALQRGLQRGWLSGTEYTTAVARAWHAVKTRTSSSGGFIDVCDSTAGITTLEQYLQRTAIQGRDARGGAMAMLFATELMQPDTAPIGPRTGQTDR